MFFSGFPGFQGHGMDDDMGGMGRRRGPVDNSKFYNLLGIEKDAEQGSIKKAYRKMAIQHHPDKGGDPEKFKEISRAYEVLSDPEKRRRYDQGGEEAVEDGGGSGDAHDIFDMFFGGGGGRGRQQQRKRKTKDVVHNMPVTLEHLYNGNKKKMAITREVLNKEAGVKRCEQCDGRGVRTQVVRMGPMIQQTQSPCGACSGQGKSFRTKKEREVLEVYIDKGAKDGHKVTFHGKSDEHPDCEPGDVIFTLQQQDHPEFIRKGADLFIKRDITLVEALTGFSLTVKHLDGRNLIIKNKPGEVMQPLTYDPIAGDVSVEWEKFEGYNSCEGDDVAQANTSDVASCKNVAERKQFTAFVMTDNGQAHFKQLPRHEIIAGKKKQKGATLYVIPDELKASKLRMMKCVKGEGMPTHANPFVCGNLFIILNIVFPSSVDASSIDLLKKALPGPTNQQTLSEDDPNVEIHYLETMDPVESRKATAGHDSGDAYDEDDEHHHHGAGQNVQCAQQ